MEINEFHGMILDGNGPDRSAFLSAFFTLVGTHGTHVTFGLIWMAVMMGQVVVKGLTVTRPVPPDAPEHVLALSGYRVGRRIYHCLPDGGHVNEPDTHRQHRGEQGKSSESYGIGFILSIVLTAIAFALVMSGALSRPAILIGIFGAAIVQILVHLHYFLHLDTSSAARWNVLALVFTLLIMILFVGGTHLDHVQPELPHDVTMT